MLLGVQLRGVLMVLGGVQRMAVRDLGMVRGLFVMTGLMVFGGFAMVFGRVLVMVRGVFVMLVDLVAFHRCLPGSDGETNNRRLR
jgi:hypothetical protein